ncbi:MAG: Uma2 family endonuclease [Pirellulaceae bacterium]
MSDPTIHLPSKDGEPAWEAAYFFPPQGHWSDETFLQLDSNRMAELVAGRLEILPMPNPLHQLIVIFFLDLIREHLKRLGLDGIVLVAPTPTRLFSGTIREPDLLYIAPEHRPENLNDYPTQIDLAVEVVSDGAEARKRDYEDKRIDYAKAGVSEYWIVDPQDKLVTVLTLDGNQYVERGVFSAGKIATSRLLEGLTVSVDAVWAVTESGGKPGI